MHKTQQTLKDKVDMIWSTTSDIFQQLKIVKHNLKKIRRDSEQLRTNYLIKKASAMEIVNNKTARNKIININKIEQIIKM